MSSDRISREAPKTLYGLAAETMRTQGLIALLFSVMLVGGGYTLYTLGNRVTDGLLLFLTRQSAISEAMSDTLAETIPFMERVSSEHRDQQLLLKLATDNQEAIIQNQEQMIELQKQTIACLEKRGQIPD